MQWMSCAERNGSARVYARTLSRLTLCSHVNGNELSFRSNEYDSDQSSPRVYILPVRVSFISLAYVSSAAATSDVDDRTMNHIRFPTRRAGRRVQNDVDANGRRRLTCRLESPGNRSVTRECDARVTLGSTESNRPGRRSLSHRYRDDCRRFHTSRRRNDAPISARSKPRQARMTAESVWGDNGLSTIARRLHACMMGQSLKPGDDSMRIGRLVSAVMWAVFMFGPAPYIYIYIYIYVCVCVCACIPSVCISRMYPFIMEQCEYCNAVSTLADSSTLTTVIAQCSLP